MRQRKYNFNHIEKTPKGKDFFYYEIERTSTETFIYYYNSLNKCIEISYYEY